jgi:hypothetical protein
VAETLVFLPAWNEYAWCGRVDADGQHPATDRPFGDATRRR